MLCLPAIFAGAVDVSDRSNGAFYQEQIDQRDARADAKIDGCGADDAVDKANDDESDDDELRESWIARDMQMRQLKHLGDRDHAAWAPLLASSRPLGPQQACMAAARACLDCDAHPDRRGAGGRADAAVLEHRDRHMRARVPRPRRRHARGARILPSRART